MRHTYTWLLLQEAPRSLTWRSNSVTDASITLRVDARSSVPQSRSTKTLDPFVFSGRAPGRVTKPSLVRCVLAVWGRRFRRLACNEDPLKKTT
jgi:hypothetical protein